MLHDKSLPNSDLSYEKIISVNGGTTSLTTRLTSFRQWFTNNHGTLHPSVSMVNTDATDGTKHAPVLTFGSSDEPPNISSKKRSSRCGVVDGPMDQILYERTTGCQIRLAKELKKEEVVMRVPRELWVDENLVKRSDAGYCAWECLRKEDNDCKFWQVFGDYEEKVMQFIRKNQQWSGTQLLVKILQERKKIENYLIKAAKNEQDSSNCNLNCTIGESKQEKVYDSCDDGYTCALTGSISTQAPFLLFLIHQRFSNMFEPPVQSINNTSATTNPQTYAPYARVLPPFIPLPICWKRHELALLAGCSAGLSLLQEIAAHVMILSSDLYLLIKGGILHRFPTVFKKNMITWDRWIWAASVYLSRKINGNDIYNNDWETKLGVMIPGLDMLNHEVGSEQIQVGTASKDEITDIIVMTRKRIKKGCEIYTHYTPVESKELILRYGFAQMRNPKDTLSMEWGLHDGIGNVNPTERYVKMYTNNIDTPIKYYVYESNEPTLMKQWWTQARLSLLQTTIQNYASVYGILQRGTKMIFPAFNNGVYDNSFLNVLVIATMPPKRVFQYIGDRKVSSIPISLTKQHQTILRHYLHYYYKRELEKLLMNVRNGLKDHFIHLNLWTHSSCGGLHYPSPSTPSATNNTYTGWHAFFDSTAYTDAIDLESRYYAISPESCVLTLYDGYLRAAEMSVEGVSTLKSFENGVGKQLMELGFVLSDGNDHDNDNNKEVDEKEKMNNNFQNVSDSDKNIEESRMKETANKTNHDEEPEVEVETRLPLKGSIQTTYNTQKDSPKKVTSFIPNTYSTRCFHHTQVKVVKLHIGNLSFKTTSHHLYEYFTHSYGPNHVQECHIPTERESGKSRGFGFVTMNESAARHVLQCDHPQELHGRLLKVSESNAAGGAKGIHNGNNWNITSSPLMHPHPLYGMGNNVNKRHSFPPHITVPPHESLYASHPLPYVRNSPINSYCNGYPSRHSNQHPYHPSIEHHGPLRDYFYIRRRGSRSSSRSKSYGRYRHLMRKRYHRHSCQRRSRSHERDREMNRKQSHSNRHERSRYRHLSRSSQSRSRDRHMRRTRNDEIKHEKKSNSRYSSLVEFRTRRRSRSHDIRHCHDYSKERDSELKKPESDKNFPSIYRSRSQDRKKKTRKKRHKVHTSGK